jgi:predicted amidophosphoribosyltransferase
MSVARTSYGAPVLDALFPLACPGCGGRAAPGGPVCLACAATMRRALRGSPPTGVDEWAVAFEYMGVARELVARVKYRNVRAVVPWLAAAMAQAAVERGLGAGVVTWAPTTSARRRVRGFDPAELLARAVARALGEASAGLLVRRPGPPQTGLAAAARRAGPRFEPRRRAPPAVLLVDDIATTGATLAAAAAALRRGGAQRVVAVTAARTPPPGVGQRVAGLAFGTS